MKALAFLKYVCYNSKYMEVNMANIKSAKKRIEVTNRQTLENKSYKSKIATQIKKYKAAIDSEDKGADKLLSEIFSLIDSAVSKKILQKATADRKKARISSYKKQA